MGTNCNTLTCSIDGKITPQDAPGAADAATQRPARGCASSDRTGRRPCAPRSPVPPQPHGTVGIPQRPNDPAFTLREPGAVPRRPQAEPRQPGSTTVTIRHPPPAPGTGTSIPDRPQGITTQPEQPTQLFRVVDPLFPGNNVVIGDGGATVGRITDRKPTDLGGGSADTPSDGNVGGLGPLTHVDGAQPGATTKAPEQAAATEGMVLGELTPASATTKAAGALDVRRCYERFMALTPPMQARVLTTGILGRYQLAQLAARDIANGVPGAATTAANWLFNTFPLEAAEQVVFCNAVHYTAPGGLLVNVMPNLPRANIAPAAQQSIDQWSMAGRTASVGARREWMRGPTYLPAGAMATGVDYAGALNLFRSLATAQQVATLGSIAFEGDAYAQALAQGLAQGYTVIDGVPIVDLAAAHISLIPAGDPRWVLFAFAAQNATAPAGDLWGDLTNALGFGATTSTASTGRNVTAPSTTRPTSTTTRPTSTTTRPTSTTTTRPTPAQAAAEAAQAQAMTVSSEFLQAAGLTSSQWAQLSRERPEMAAQLFREFQNRPNTFQQVAATVLQAAQTFLLGLHQQNVDDLAAANASYQHQQAMAQAAIQREQTELGRAQLALQQQQLAQQSQMVAMTPNAIVSQPAEQAQQPPAEGMSYGAKVGIAGAVAAVIGLGYVATRKRNGRAKVSRRRTRRAA